MVATAHGRSRPLTAGDLGLEAGAAVRLAGRISVSRRVMAVRVENIEIARRFRARTSLSSTINGLKAMARLGGMDRLVIESVNVGNARLARILIVRHAGVTPRNGRS